MNGLDEMARSVAFLKQKRAVVLRRLTRRGDRAGSTCADSVTARLIRALVTAIFAAIARRRQLSGHQRWAHRLPSLDACRRTPAGRRARPVSVVIAARDEAAAIEAPSGALLAQQGVALEVIVVSDRSIDGTADIVRRLGGRGSAGARRRGDARCPTRWLGKSHALHIGAAAATGDWILFTDADCRLAPDVVARALRGAARERVDHVALTPAPIAAHARRQRLVLVFGASIANWFGRANRDLPGGHFGFGAFNLVRDLDVSRLRRLRGAATDGPRRRPPRPAGPPRRRPLSRLPRRPTTCVSLGHELGDGDPPHREELLRGDRLPHAGGRRPPPSSSCCSSGRRSRASPRARGWAWRAACRRSC